MTQHRLEKMAIDDGAGKKARLSMTKDGKIQIRQLEAEVAVLRDTNTKLAADNEIYRNALRALKGLA